MPGFGTFLPVILKNGFDFSTEQAQYLVIPGELYMLPPANDPHILPAKTNPMQ